MRAKQRVTMGCVAAAVICAGSLPRAARAQNTPDAVSQENDAIVPQRSHLALRTTAGGSGRALFDAYVVGGKGDIGVGVDSPYGSYGLAGSFFGGVVEGGLTVLHGTVGFDMAWPIGIVRLGIQPRVGYIDIDRVTTERQFGAYTFGVATRVSVDVMRQNGVALAIGLEPTAEVVAALGNDGKSQDGAAPLLGGSGFFEVRWRRAD